MMAGNMMAGSRIVDWMRSGCAISRGDALRATQMQWRLARYPGAETEPTAAVMASILRHRAQRVALGMIAGSAAWTPGRAGGRYHDDAHGFILAVSSAALRNFPTSRLRFTLELLTICSKTATYS